MNQKTKEPSSKDLIAEELNKLAKQSGGILYPEKIVRAASDKESVMHSWFEWDNNKASHEYRLWQARKLIKIYVIVEASEGEMPINTFVSLSTDRQSGGGYRTMASIMSDKRLKTVLLNDALRDMQYFQSRYYSLEKYLGKVFKEMSLVERLFRKKKIIK